MASGSSSIRPAGAGYRSPAPAPALVQGSARPGKQKHGKRGHAHAHDQWNCADLLDTSKAKKRVFYWEVQSSLREMSASTFYESPLTTAQAVMFHPATDAPGSERQGDPTRAILLDGRIREITNRFPTTMVLSSNLLSGRTYGLPAGSSTAVRGIAIVPGNRTIDYAGDDGRFLLPHPSLMSDVVRRFAKDGHRNLLEECVLMKDTGNYMVPKDSPIMVIIENNEARIREEVRGFSVRKLVCTDGKYLLPPDFVLEAVDVFEKAIKTRMPHVDMTRLSLRLSRYGANWLDAVVQSSDESQNERLHSLQGHFSVSVELTYRLPSSSA